MIATRLHRLAEIGVDDSLLALMQGAPKFVVAPDLMEILGRDDVQRSILAMVEADIARLPYPRLVVEFSVDPAVRRFVLLEESAEGFTARLALLAGDRLASVSVSSVLVRLSAAGFKVDRHADQKEGMAAALAVTIALLMLNIRGVRKDVIEVERLNRQRLRTGKPAVPGHTVVRIGTIYDRSGRAAGEAPGRRMPVHLRAGHARMQVCGPERADRKLIFVPPVLVNYRPETDDVPRLPEKVLRR